MSLFQLIVNPRAQHLEHLLELPLAEGLAGAVHKHALEEVCAGEQINVLLCHHASQQHKSIPVDRAEVV